MRKLLIYPASSPAHYLSAPIPRTQESSDRAFFLAGHPPCAPIDLPSPRPVGPMSIDPTSAASKRPAWPLC